MPQGGSALPLLCLLCRAAGPESRSRVGEPDPCTRRGGYVAWILLGRGGHSEDAAGLPGAGRTGGRPRGVAGEARGGLPEAGLTAVLLERVTCERPGFAPMLAVLRA